MALWAQGARQQQGARVVPWGSLPGAVGRGGSVYPLLSSNHFLLSLLAVFFFQRARPLPPATSPPAPGPPAHLWHMPTSGPPVQPDPGPPPSPLGRQRGCTAPRPAAMPTPATWQPVPGPPQLPTSFKQGIVVVVGDAWPGHLGPLPGSQRARGPYGVRGRGLSRWLAPHSPSWVTHSPRCGCEVPRQHL